MNSIGNIECDEESTIISQKAANGNNAILINPIFQEGTSLNNLTIKPDKKRKRRLYAENPSSPVLSIGNNGDSYCFIESPKINTGSSIDAIPRMDTATSGVVFFSFMIFNFSGLIVSFYGSKL